ncbi:hypothetical protein BDFB_013343 [Asbolus verrucosus]|uniref:MARVEL domain-containing protein n=1 Tax=Asbolus verrucosus TaxID=1661398 RepID=A0A482VX94_ASBVE|nr:hypothetical protein BDFB_013343 [Asbolus verrucosus]
MTGFWLTVFLLILYLFHNVEKFYKVPWLKIELFYCSLWASLYLIAACLAATFGIEAFSAAAFFGFCAMLMYCVEGFFKFKALRNGEPAQHPRPTITPPENTIPNTPPPPYK